MPAWHGLIQLLSTNIATCFAGQPNSIDSLFLPYQISEKAARCYKPNFGLGTPKDQPCCLHQVLQSHRGESSDLRSFPNPSPPLLAVRLLEQLRERLRLLHCSLSTEKVYVYWCRTFIRFHQLRHPAEVGGPEIEGVSPC